MTDQQDAPDSLYEKKPFRAGDGPIAPADGRWHVVERRGLFYVEATGTGKDAGCYQQVGFDVRDADQEYPEISGVQSFRTRGNAEAIALALNAVEASDAAWIARNDPGKVRPQPMQR